LKAGLYVAAWCTGICGGIAGFGVGAVELANIIGDARTILTAISFRVYRASHVAA
jgi:hypothetical protein